MGQLDGYLQFFLNTVSVSILFAYVGKALYSNVLLESTLHPGFKELAPVGQISCQDSIVLIYPAHGQSSSCLRTSSICLMSG